MSAVRLVLKEFFLPKGLWDEIVQTVVYIKNHTINWSANGITPYKRVSKFVPSFAHFHAFRCQCYVHIFDSTIR